MHSLCQSCVGAWYFMGVDHCSVLPLCYVKGLCDGYVAFLITKEPGVSCYTT